MNDATERLRRAAQNEQTVIALNDLLREREARLAVAERLLREWVADAHWNPRANLPDLVIRTKHAIGAADATPASEVQSDA